MKNQKEKIILFGASKLGEKAFKTLKDEYEVICFCDNDKSKWGNKFCGKDVISPLLLLSDKYSNIKVIISSMYQLEIVLQLEELKIKDYKVFNRIMLDKEIRHKSLCINDNFKTVLNDAIRDNVTKNIDDLKQKSKSDYTIHMEAYAANECNKKLKVACILDEFSYESFKDECYLMKFTPYNWQDILTQGIDFLLVESAWRGNDGTWDGLPIILDNSNYNESRVNGVINSIISYCDENSIPTVFWNKEDPVHYDTFITLAKKFQYIFTTDKNMVPKYIEDVGHKRIYELPFAANIKIHNPIDKDIKKIGKLAFAGSWYEHHQDRKLNMETVLLPALRFGVHIYDRNYGTTSNENLMFPEIYRKNIVGRLPYNIMIDYYKKYNIFLNINTVQDSPTMFSRRVFELLACGTNVISGYSMGIQQMLGDVVLMGLNSEEIEAHIKQLTGNKELSERLSVLGVRRVIEKHTYAHRFDYIINKLKIYNHRESEKGVSIIALLTDIELLDNIIRNYTQQAYNNKELILIIKNNNIDRLQVNDYIENIDNIYLYKIEAHQSLGECLNYAIHRSNKDYISIFDENDYYGENYLIDLLNAFKYSNAGIVGKATIFKYLEGKTQLVVRNKDSENKYCDHVFYSTLVMKKSVLLDNLFSTKHENPHPEFMDECIKQNIKIYSTDKYNYIQFIKGKDAYSMKETILKKTVKDSISFVSV